MPVLLHRMVHGMCANLPGINVCVTLTCYTSPYIQLSTTTSILMYVHRCNWKFYTMRFITLCNMGRNLGDRKLHKINTLQIFCLSDNFITSPYMIKWSALYSAIVLVCKFLLVVHVLCAAPTRNIQGEEVLVGQNGQTCN